MGVNLCGKKFYNIGPWRSKEEMPQKLKANLEVKYIIYSPPLQNGIWLKIEWKCTF